ncbi:MAG: hypothetical protein OXI87_03995 [Albidovulum sp.]|nr:hypothetical protein [Albidovulum sp.]MDE0529979.1 hypothetical protein [Albidovulum sp.]
MAWTESSQPFYKRTGDHRQNDPTDKEWSLIESMNPARWHMGRYRETDPCRF